MDITQIKAQGSPPHLRGKLCILAFRHFKARITPAPAGKTWNSCRFVLAGWDHPRTCGENFPQGRFQVRHLGSPPHLRGKPFKKEIYDAATRITPAPAGKTNNMTHCFYLFEDHPRTCGENKRGDVSQCSFGGSPPHLRGKLQGRIFLFLQIRITPAPAGKTRNLHFSPGFHQDHPRTCGENIKFQ